MTALLPSLLDPRVLSAEGSPKQLGPAATLLPEEEQAIARAVASRRAQYAATRVLARRLLGHLGWPNAALLNRQDRSPIWPHGVVGSITHTDDWCGVAVADARHVSSLGIDVERMGRIDGALSERVLTKRERCALPSGPPPSSSAPVRAAPTSAARRKDVHLNELPSELLWATLSFSAKEAVYKCIFPSIQRYVGFNEVEIDIDIDQTRFRVTPIGVDFTRDQQRLIERLRGRFAQHHDHWVTSCQLYA